VRAEITKEFTFEAAHHLPPVGPDHKCFRLHGHLFRVEVTVAGDVDPAMGWVMDFAELAAACQGLIGELDHRVLNDVPGLGVPTSENVARWLCDRLHARFPGLSEVTVHESPTSRCTVRPGAGATSDGSEVTIEAGASPALAFSAAHFLLLPGGREPIHGHDYRVRVAATYAGGAPAGASDLLASCAREAIADLDHRLLVAGRPAIGSVERTAREVRVVLPGETLTLPAADVAMLDAANTTTEALAAVLAARVAAMPALVAGGARRVTVRVTEGLDASATASATVP
jgi:6-pyruvoyltetrahydropterin/6-carboxytetrahydropterin synthase